MAAETSYRSETEPVSTREDLPPAEGGAAPPQSPPKRPSRSTRFKLTLIRVGIVILAAAIAYGVGRLQGSLNVNDVEQEARQTLETRDERLAEMKTRSQHRQAELQQLEARRRLHRALLELDNRNFGIAQKHLQAAAGLLAKSRPESGSKLAKLSQSLEGFKLVATEDLGSQRSKLVGWVEQFDEAMPLAKP